MLWLFVAMLGALPPSRPGYTVDRWGVEEGLPNNALSAVLQSRDGYLWVATWAGTVRFDGVRFTPIARDLPNDHVHALLEGHDGTIWIGVSGAGLVRWRAAHVDVFTVKDGLAGEDVRALAEDADGRIWAGTEHGVSVIDGARISSYGTAQGLRDDIVNGVARARDGGVWIATASGVCHAIVSDLTCDSRTYPGVLNAILEDGGGRVWVGTTNGLWSGNDRRFPGESVTALREMRDGALVAGFGDGGVAVIRDRVARYGAADGLPAGGAVVDISEDREGSVWIATYNAGLGRLKPARVATYSIADGLPAKVVGSIVEDAKGTVWAGTQCGPVSELRDGRFVPRFTEFTRDACAWVMWPARDGSLWIGTRGDGLFHWSGGRMTHIGLAEGLSDLRIAGLFEDRDGVLWIGTELGGLHTYANGRLSRSFGPADGVVSGYLASFAQDRDGRVWIGSNANGLSVFEGGRFRMLAPEESPPTHNIANLMVDSRGDLWVGSAASGLFRRRHGRYEAFGEAQGLGDRLVAVILEDRDGAIWVSTSRGISRLSRDEIEAVGDGRQAVMHPIILDRSDGMRNPEGSGGGLDPSGLRDRDGRLWFSTIDGIAVVDPASFRLNRLAPSVRVESAAMGGRASSPAGQSLDVPAGTASIAIDYTTFSFLAPAKVRFRYRLRGYDTEWQDVGMRRTAYYSRLPPGRYTFDVLAANNDGVWSLAPASVAVVVAPFVWERRPVQAAALLLMLAATALIVRQASLRRARSRLQELERDQALNRERSRIARDLHDDLGSRLTHIAMMADVGTQADQRIAHAARDAARTMDELVWAVNARNDTVEGFAFYLAQFAEEHIAAAGIRCRLMLPPDLPAREIGADVRRHLYLASKEAINNAVKHAGASEIHVLLSVNGGRMVVEIADNGCGLPASVDPTGNGLKNYRERMVAAGGSVQVGSSAGRGTRIVFAVPLQVM